MEILLVIALAVLALVAVSLSSLAARADGPRDVALRPSLRTRRWLAAAVSVLALGGHLWTWLVIRRVVPEGTPPGTVLYGGPGDGLWFILAIVGSWLLAQPINVALACFCARTWKQASCVGAVLLAAWVCAATLGGALSECPAGMVCAGG